MISQTIGIAENIKARLPVPTKRLLLVEDDAPMREALSEMVQEWSFAPSVAANFREARNAVITEEPFAIIVSDYHLPDGNGLELLDWLKREMLIHVPFLLISGGVTRTPSATDDYEFLAKPFLMGEFRRRLEKLSSLKLQPVASYTLTPAQEAMASVYACRRPPKTEQCS
jgi:DNA-binding NtrC family response regulator